MRVTLIHAGLEKRFAAEVETATYHIVQEALTNVARHAAVDEATVRLCVQGEKRVVQVEGSVAPSRCGCYQRADR